MPDNSSLVSLSAAGSPLENLHQRKITWSFYGDSITWVNTFEPVIKQAFEKTEAFNVSLINQGINGGTAGDVLRRGSSPWGHLDPFKKPSNISFVDTLRRDEPDVVGLQIGINDYMQHRQDELNTTAYGADLDQLIAVIQQTLPKVELYMCTISVDGEEIDNKNHQQIRAWAAEMEAVGKRNGNIPVINLFELDLEYLIDNNCVRRIPHN
eukprot:SAG31_NODE_140_length_22731_cov_10.941410_7_plen_210_part_00